jgi:hypothetical protein
MICRHKKTLKVTLKFFVTVTVGALQGEGSRGDKREKLTTASLSVHIQTHVCMFINPAVNLVMHSSIHIPVHSSVYPSIHLTILLFISRSI